MLDGWENAFYVDATGASGGGLIDRLFESRIEYLLIDEIDKMKKADQVRLLNAMETGILSETKLKDKARKKKLSINLARQLCCDLVITESHNIKSYL